VVTWGEKHFLELVLDPLNRVQQIQATCCSFAAILEDGSVVTWGCRGWGGDSSEVRDQLQGVRQIQATHYGAFAAILEDGSVVTWGCEDRGGDSSAVRDQLKGVSQIQATDGAFAAILEDGSVVSWGSEERGGDSSAVRDQLRGVQHIQSTHDAFAAILEDGSVISWGDEIFGIHYTSHYSHRMSLRSALTEIECLWKGNILYNSLEQMSPATVVVCLCGLLRLS